ncbi:MAG TPA: serine/threonine protein kinase [Candidatus Hydrogenedentes bacterium]|nr:serine/threonine protein kinase [Candidatus Hydrogenedentota bacterium]
MGALVCDALAEAHKHGVIHRDIKPANILMPTDAAPKVADFGIARVEDSNLTQEGAMIGTPHYMSPEQFMGQRANARSDLFSVGIIVYEMLTGEKPFGGEALSTVMHNVIKSEPIAPTELNFAINDCLNKVVLKALSKRPQDRYQSAAEMAAALRESLKPSPDPAVTQVEAGEPGATVAGQAPEDMATIVAAKLPDGDESPAASPRRPAGKKLPIPAIIAGVTVTVIALVAAISLLAGGKEEAGGEGGTPQESGRPAPPPQPDAYFKAANIVLVCVDDTGEPYTQASEAVERAIDQGSRLPELSGIEGCSLGNGKIVLTQIGKGEQTLEVDVRGGSKHVALDGHAWDKFRVVATSEGYLGAEDTCTATEPGETASVMLILLKQ